ncbi:MAG: SGNH/GDSL hydrolase family protein, partial [Bdellovibrionales bacterium]|nr:SGNH/GDSL hydrolase family protein [Bdellovibrionales bacterium]
MNRPLARNDALLFLIFLVFGGWFFYGFTRTDPYLAAQTSWMLAKGLPLCGAVLYVLFLLLLLGLRTGYLSSSSFFLVIGGLGIGALILFPFGSEWFYHKRFTRKLEGYHSILQLSPPAYEPRAVEGKKIFCLGGSTTAWADSQGQDWPSRVQSKLREQTREESVQIYNLGKEWYTTLHSLINYETNLRTHKPDMIIVMHGVNDLLMNADFSYFSTGAFREDYVHFLGPIKDLI